MLQKPDILKSYRQAGVCQTYVRLLIPDAVHQRPVLAREPVYAGSKAALPQRSASAARIVPAALVPFSLISEGGVNTGPRRY